MRTEITTEDQFVPGAAVFIVTEDGDVALPPGKYEMMDNGQTLIVEEAGIIAGFALSLSFVSADP